MNDPASAPTRPLSARPRASLATRDGDQVTTARAVAITWGETLVLMMVGGVVLALVATHGLALLIGLCLDRADHRLTRAWSLAVVVIAIGGLASNHASWYWWQRAADAARQVDERVLPSPRGLPINTLTFAAAEQPFWQWTLTADEKGPMIPMLLGQPALRVRVVSNQELPRSISGANPTNPVVAIDEGFAIYPRR